VEVVEVVEVAVGEMVQKSVGILRIFCNSCIKTAILLRVADLRNILQTVT
jgi:hypothetical protein